MEELTLFDFFPGMVPEKSINDLTLEELSRILSERLNVPFKIQRKYRDFTLACARVGKADIEVDFGNYNSENGERFIAVDVKTKLAGAGRPCDSIEEAVSSLKTLIERFGGRKPWERK